jgi:hypothetical protein
VHSRRTVGASPAGRPCPRDSATSSGTAAGILRRLQWDGTDLRDPSVVLLRIENVGWTPIVEDDYVAPANDPVAYAWRSRAAAWLRYAVGAEPPPAWAG